MLGFNFIYPWLLLLFIPALLVTLIPHFRLTKRFRRTRNRIISLVMRLIAFVFAITLLAGMTITYTIPNDGNEIILLVDVSDNISYTNVAKRDDCVDDIVFGVKEDLEGAKLGIVTFGYDQKYVAPLSDDIDEVYDQYIMALETPDTTATNIASALRFAKKQFTEEATWKKIIIVSDGKETDEEAIGEIKQLLSDENGIMHIDVIDVTTIYDEEDAQVVGVEMPDYHVNANQECEIKVHVQSNTAGQELSIALFDNNEQNTMNGNEGVVSVVSNGTADQTVTFKHVFNVGGLHELRIEMQDAGNYGEKNNIYTTFYYIEIFNKVLIYESGSGESEGLRTLLEDPSATLDGPYEVTILCVHEAMATQLPKTVDDYRQYDQVIFNNIANSDIEIIDQTIYSAMTDAEKLQYPTLDSFVGYSMGLIYQYVHDFGGGLFTVGGSDSTGDAHAYNRADMKGTVYQSMLPVQIIDYTPPVGVMLIIDRSGSMSADKLTAAREAAYACLDVLTERDYVGIMTLDNTFATILEMTSVMHKDRIREAIDTIQEATGGTMFPQAINRAGMALKAMDQVAKRHIILITDGAPGGSEDDYLNYVKQYYQNDGTTISVAVVGSGGASAAAKMQKICDAAGGAEKGSNLYMVANPDNLANEIMGDLNAPQIKEMDPEPFNPIITNLMSQLTAGFGTLPDFPNKMIAQLGGFFGTKLKTDAEMILAGDYNVPLYAQWGFGEGMVGSFMSDLKGSGDSWSAEFMGDKDGIQFILNVIANLMPSENIRPSELIYEFTEDNYTNNITIFNTFEQGEYIDAKVYIPSPAGGQDVLYMNMNVLVDPEENISDLDCYVTTNFTNNPETFNTLVCDFVIKKPGVYRIDIVKHNADGTPTDIKLSFYKTLAYSEEYDTFEAEEEATIRSNKLKDLAARGEGIYTKAETMDTAEVLATEDKIVKTLDPRTLFMILAIIFVLIDIAVRKFKFKWIHEIIREKRQKKV